MDDPKAVARGRSPLVLSSLIVLLCSSTFVACAWMKVALREAGEYNKTMPAKVAKEYHCDKRELPFFQIEKSQLVPDRPKPGQDMSHRLIYVMCPRRPTEVVTGRLDTRVLFKGETIFQDVIDQELKPGRWVLDSFVPLPEEAEPGVYALQVEFRSAQGNLRESSDFIVKAKE